MPISFIVGEVSTDHVVNIGFSIFPAIKETWIIILDCISLPL